ncbi:MAG: hypothetical protein ACREJM_08055, partial [Candidatus Saccharimonadales bacterium]
MSQLKGITSSAVAGAIIGFALGYFTYKPTGCLDICIGTAGLVGVIFAVVGLAAGIFDGLAIASLSLHGWRMRPRSCVAVGAGLP